MTIPPRIEAKLAKSRAEIDDRVRTLVERIDAERAEATRVVVKQASELSPAERARCGFGPSWAPCDPTTTPRTRRRPR